MLTRKLIQRKLFTAALHLSTCVVLVLLQGGCISTNTPGDFSLSSVQMADPKERQKIDKPSRNPLIVSDGDALHRKREAFSAASSTLPEPLLKVTFLSRTNLVQFASSNSYNLGVYAVFCGANPDVSNLSDPNIYWHGARLMDGQIDPILTVDHQLGSNYEYYFFVHVDEFYRPQDPTPQLAFNLQRSGADVCFWARGGNEAGFGYISNTVRIPGSSIAAALKKVGTSAL